MARQNDGRHSGMGAGRPPIRSSKGGRAAEPRRPSAYGGSPHPPHDRVRDISHVQTQRRRRRRQNYTVHYIILALMLTALGIILSLTVFFRVEKIEVGGTQFYSAQQVLDALDAREGDNLLRLKLERLEENVRQRLVRSEQVDVRRKFPNTLVVEVTDAVVTEQVLSGGFSYQISSGGRIVAIEPDAVVNVRIVIGPDLRVLNEGENISRLKELDAERKEENTKDAEAYTNTRKLELLQTLKNELERIGIPDISMIDVRDSVSLKLLYQNRFEIRLGTPGDLQDKLAMFSSVLERGSLGLEEKGILDISDPDRCIASRDLPSLPDGTEEAGWVWQGPHLENFDEFFGYGSDVPPVESGVLVGGEEQETSSEPVSEPEQETSSGETSEPVSEVTSDGGDSSSKPSYVMPQRPSIGGGSGESHEPSSEPESSEEPSSEPAIASVPQREEPSSEPSAASSGPEETGSSSSSSPGYAMPQMPSVGR
ncbi:MAG: FtsQ-type POTRA domain-containing protein [Oscillospiraceae bacterium]|nr:FtsQ-type POTRA domain-containing protein [Oscillospiraceae bacterium]